MLTPGAGMQRWTGLLLALFLIGSGILVVLKGGPEPAAPAIAPDAGADAADGGVEGDAEPGDAAELVDAEVAGETADAGGTLISGEAAPALPADAPKSVVFGVVLLQYKGAQGAPPTARSRAEALQLAKDLAATAKDDFKGAVLKGDKGSMENAGRLPRGVLEPAPEYVVFTLPKGGVSEPVDTPRGYWIVHRIE